MSLTSVTVTHQPIAAVPTQPTTSETIANPTENDVLEVTVGGTATTVAVVTPGTDTLGSAIADISTGSISNTTRAIRLARSMADPATGLATVTFSQVTAVTAILHRK